MSAPPVAVPIQPAEHTEMLTYCACAGFWSRAEGAMSAPPVAVPIPAEHTEMLTYCACAGFWSRAVGAMSAPPVAVPIPAEHTEMLTYCACAGFWSRAVGAMSAPSVAVPIQPAEHYHLHTKPVPDLPPDTPVVRDPDGYVYFRENEGRFLAGGFEPRVGVPWTK
jgi:uncharacterized protein (DUF2237 family)